MFQHLYKSVVSSWVRKTVPRLRTLAILPKIMEAPAEESGNLKRKIDGENGREQEVAEKIIKVCDTLQEGDKKPKKEPKEPKIRKTRGPPPEIDTSLDVSDYYIENGLRKVYPYAYPFYSYCKGRWVGLSLKELFQREFRYCPEEIMEKRILNGHLKVNKEARPLTYILKDGDFITHEIHRHEFPVLAVPIPIIHMDDDLLVIDKPPSMPIHPCGKYRLNTVTSILEKENKLSNIHVIHRLDRLTSGVMIMARNKAKAQKVHERMRNREMQKEYVCRVVGKFPDGVIEVNEPLDTLSHRVGISVVAETGKESKTTFERLNYNGKSSTVLAKPHTGRMHQIRVHLQWLGYPIVNDSFYNTDAWGPERGKNGQFGKTVLELIQAVDLEHQRTNHIVSRESGSSASTDPRDDPEKARKDVVAIKALEHYFSQAGWKEKTTEYEEMRKKKTDLEATMKPIDDCFECLNPCFDPTPSEQLIYLHALRYRVDEEWSFESQMPVWAMDSWTED